MAAGLRRGGVPLPRHFEDTSKTLPRLPAGCLFLDTSKTLRRHFLDCGRRVGAAVDRTLWCLGMPRSSTGSV